MIEYKQKKLLVDTTMLNAYAFKRNGLYQLIGEVEAIDKVSRALFLLPPDYMRTADIQG
jgi:hypothetical protein